MKSAIPCLLFTLCTFNAALAGPSGRMPLAEQGCYSVEGHYVGTPPANAVIIRTPFMTVVAPPGTPVRIGWRTRLRRSIEVGNTEVNVSLWQHMFGR